MNVRLNRLGATMQRPLNRGERGAATVESVGMYAVAAIFASGLVLVTVGASPMIQDRFRQAVCLLTTAGQGDCELSTSAAQSRKPTTPCVVSAEGHKGAVEGGALLSVGANEELLVEKLNNGKYRVTRGTGTNVDLSGGVGGNATVTWNDKTIGGAAIAEGGVAATFASGEVYYANNEDEVNDIRWAHTEDVTKDIAFGGQLAPLRPLVDRAEEWLNIGKPLPAPDGVYGRGGFDADAKAQATALTANVQLSGGAQVLLGVRRGTNGTSTTYYKVSVDLGLSAGTWAGDAQTNQTVYAKAGLEGKKDDIIEVERDSSGTITSVRNKSVVSTKTGAAEDGGDVHDGKETQTYEELVTELPIETPTDQEITQRYFNAVGLAPMSGFDNRPADVRGYLPGNPLDALSPTREFAQAAGHRGFVTKQTFNNENSGRYALTVEGEAIVKVGGNVSVDKTSRTSTGAQYLQGKTWTTWEGCGGQ